jgi:hypothetical protein
VRLESSAQSIRLPIPVLQSAVAWSAEERTTRTTATRRSRGSHGFLQLGR